MHYTVFDDKGFEDYKNWQIKDKSKYKQIHKLIASIFSDGPLDGYGKPELLKYKYKSAYSRRIDEKNRLIYRYEKDEKNDIKLLILGCFDHYGGKENVNELMTDLNF